MAPPITFVPVAETFGRMILCADADFPLGQLDKRTVIDLFKCYSLLWFRGFDIGSEEFVAFSNQFGLDFIGYVGGAYQRETVGDNQTLLSVTGKRQFFPVPFHGEMYYMEKRPTILYFYCMHPPVSGGETTACDGAAVYQALRKSTQELFVRKRLLYVRRYNDRVWQGIYQSDDPTKVQAFCHENNMRFSYNKVDGSIVTEYVTSAIGRSLYGNHEVFINNILPVVAQETAGLTSSLVRFEDGAMIPDEIITEMQEVTERCAALVSWQKNDFVMVDNTRLMHGRRGFSDTQREIYMRMSRAAF